MQTPSPFHPQSLRPIILQLYTAVVKEGEINVEDEGISVFYRYNYPC